MKRRSFLALGALALAPLKKIAPAWQPETDAIALPTAPLAPATLQCKQLTGKVYLSKELLDDAGDVDLMAAIKRSEQMALEQFIAKCEGRPDPYPEWTAYLESRPDEYEWDDDTEIE